jgi:hypothetical protein
MSYNFPSTATIRKLGRPPHLIMRIMDCVLILFQRKLHAVIADTGAAAPCPKPSWAESLKVRGHFVEKLSVLLISRISYV